MNHTQILLVDNTKRIHDRLLKCL